MTLHIIPAYTPAGTRYQADPVRRDQMEACLAVYASSDTDPGVRHVFADLAAHLRDRQLWLACDCTGEAADPPMLHARRMPNGQATLVRMPGRRPHAASCPFHLDPGTGGPVRLDPGLDGPLQDGAFGILKPIKASAGPHGAREPRSGAAPGRRIPKLARVLFSILHGAGVLRSEDGHVLLLPDQYAALRKTMAGLRLSPHLEHLTVNAVTALHPSQIQSVVDRIKGHDWGRELTPHGFLITPVQSFLDRELVAGSLKDPVTLTLATDPIVPGRQTDGPYMGCFLIGPTSSLHHRFELLRGYLHPIVDRLWLCPVDSGLERSVVPLLRGQQAYWSKGHGVGSILEKPVFSIYPGEQVIPDFIYRHTDSNGKVIVEVMGSTDPEYRERKSRTHSRMADWAPIVTITPDDMNDLPRLKKRLTKVVLTEFGA